MGIALIINYVQCFIGRAGEKLQIWNGLFLAFCGFLEVALEGDQNPIQPKCTKIPTADQGRPDPQC